MRLLAHILRSSPDTGTLIADESFVTSTMRVPTGCAALDDLLDGGVESAALTEFFGEAGAGKSNVCLMLARNVARQDRKVVYIDTEGVSLERLQQICGADYRKVYGNILFFEPFSLREQEAVVEKAARLAASADVGIIIVDSATLLYRLTLGTGDDMGGRRAIASQLQTLVTVARKRHIPVVITNQVFTNIDKNDELEPIGGQLLRHLSKAVVRLEKPQSAGASGGVRRATILKHRSVAEGLASDFVITRRGLESPGGGDDVPTPADVAAPEGGASERAA